MGSGGAAICPGSISRDNLELIKISLPPNFMLQRIPQRLVWVEGQSLLSNFSLLIQIIEKKGSRPSGRWGGGPGICLETSLSKGGH